MTEFSYNQKRIPLIELDLERRYVLTKLICPDALVGVRLHPDCISSNPLRLVYLAILRCEADTGNADIVEVLNILEHEGNLGTAVTREFVVQLGNEGTDSVLLDGKSTANRLTKLALARKQREQLLGVITQLENGDYDAARESIVETAGLAISGSDTIIKSAYELATNTYEILSEPEDNKKKKIPLGIPLVDNAVGGLTPGSMSVIGGYTATGKSSLLLLAALNQARAGYRVGVVSCEDTAEVWGARLLAHLSNVPASQLFRGEFSNERLENILSKIVTGVEESRSLPLNVAYCIGSVTVGILEASRKLIVDERCDILYIDYIQAVRVDMTLRRYDKAVGDIAKQLKGMCNRYQVPLVIASQLSRPKEKAYREPFLTDLKETGDIENESEIVMLLWNSSDKIGAETYFKIAKCKWAMAGTRGTLKRSTTNGMIVGIVENLNEKECDNKEQHTHWQD